ncbi:MAG: MgtC/SapB family protein [Firmicutes bacterium]|nr:MgtC/SapB family protein [Bacillota bacterium]
MMDIGSMLGKLVLATILGGIVGWEREVHDRPAGLRTHMLVCLGSTLITLVSMSFGTTSDPSRIAAQIVSGIGFLGAGTILRQGNVVRGLTTAASLWTTAGIGLAVAVGKGLLILAVLTTLIVFLTLSVLSRLESSIGKKNIRQLRLEIPAQETSVLTETLEKLVSMGIVIRSISSREGAAGMRIVDMRVCVPRDIKAESISEMLSSLPKLTRFEWT